MINERGKMKKRKKYSLHFNIHNVYNKKETRIVSINVFYFLLIFVKWTMNFTIIFRIRSDLNVLSELMFVSDWGIDLIEAGWVNLYFVSV